MGNYLKSEEYLYKQVAQYLALQYPDVIYHFDYGSGAHLTKRAAVTQKTLNRTRGYPDLFIAQAKYKDNMTDYYGLFIELKADGARLFKKDLSPASEHIAEQQAMLIELENRGYKAVFCVGFDETKKMLDEYLRGGAEQ